MCVWHCKSATVSASRQCCLRCDGFDRLKVKRNQAIQLCSTTKQFLQTEWRTSRQHTLPCPHCNTTLLLWCPKADAKLCCKPQHSGDDPGPPTHSIRTATCSVTVARARVMPSPSATGWHSTHSHHTQFCARQNKHSSGDTLCAQDSGEAKPQHGRHMHARVQLTPKQSLPRDCPEPTNRVKATAPCNAAHNTTNTQNEAAQTHKPELPMNSYQPTPM